MDPHQSIMLYDRGKIYLRDIKIDSNSFASSHPFAKHSIFPSDKFRLEEESEEILRLT